MTEKPFWRYTWQDGPPPDWQQFFDEARDAYAPFRSRSEIPVRADRA